MAKSLMVFKHSASIPIGVKGGLAPTIKDVDWNPRPSDCDGARAMIACASTVGIKIFELKEESNSTWEPVGGRPSDVYCSTLQWNPTKGRLLATGSRGSTSQPGNLSLLTYKKSSRKFRYSKVASNVNVSSLCWDHSGNYLFAALHPSSEIVVYNMDSHRSEVEMLGILSSPLCPPSADIVIKSHPTLNHFVSCAPQSNRILIWGYHPSSSTGWDFQDSIECGLGVFSMSFNRSGTIVATIGTKDDFRTWSFVPPTKPDSKPQVILLSNQKGDHLAIKHHGRRKGHSKVMSVDCSREMYKIATGGDSDTLLIYCLKAKGVPSNVVMKMNVCMSRIYNGKLNTDKRSHVNFGEVTCIKVNPKRNARLYLAVGGDKGFIHFFAFYNSKKKNLIIGPHPYNEEYYFYSKGRRGTSVPLDISPDQESSGEERDFDDHDFAPSSEPSSEDVSLTGNERLEDLATESTPDDSTSEKVPSLVARLNSVVTRSETLQKKHMKELENMHRELKELMSRSEDMHKRHMAESEKVLTELRAITVEAVSLVDIGESSTAIPEDKPRGHRKRRKVKA